MEYTTDVVAKLTELKRTADTLDTVVEIGTMGEGEACIVKQMARAIRADVSSLELTLLLQSPLMHVGGAFKAGLH